MTATERLRALLDERGVEWGKALTDLSRQTHWSTERYWCAFTEWNGTVGIADTLTIYHISPEQAVDATLGQKVTGQTSDGYHTFDELYHHRAVLFSVIVANHCGIAWKARKHHDGTMYEGMFIVGIDTPWGQASYHYDLDPYWGMFDCEELDRAPEWDGHTPDEAIERISKLATLGRGTCGNASDFPSYTFVCSECGGRLDLVDEFDNPTMQHDDGPIGPRFCPNCGRRVVG